MDQVSAPEAFRCIWCGDSTTGHEPPEHVVPEAIGCPEDFVLRNGEVCASCNHGLAHLDQALIHDLEVYALLAGVPRKRGRGAKVSSYGNLQAEVKDSHANFFFNMDPVPVTLDSGKQLPGFRGRERDIRASIAVDGSTATIEFPLEFGRSPKVARALVKLGAEYLCWAIGRDVAADVIAGPIADFVLRGAGYRPVILTGADWSKYQHRFEHIGRVDGQGWYVYFRLAHSEVIVDLSSDLAAFRTMAPHLYETLGPKGWTTLPLDAVSVQGGKLVPRAS